MASSYTTKYEIQKPEIGAASDLWGAYLNDDFDCIDLFMGSFATTGGTTAYVLTTGRTLPAYATGQVFRLRINATNTGASTLNVDSLGAVSIVKGASTALAAGDLLSGAVYEVSYDGTNFVLVGSSSTNVNVRALAALTMADDRMIDLGGADTMAVVTYATVLNNIAAGGTITAGSGVSPALTIQRDNDAGSGVVLYYVHNSASPAASDTILSITARAKDTAANTDSYGLIQCEIMDPTSGSEDGRWSFNTMIAGVTTDRLYLGGGLYTPLVSDLGAGTINASALYEGNVAVNRLRRTTSSETSGALTTASANAVVNATAGVSIAQNVFTAGDIIWIYNNTASAITITQTSGTLRLHGTTTTGNRTLAARGWCEIYFHTAAIFIACGPDIT